MSESRLATKVGVFVLVFLVALAVLLLNFSKSGDWFKPTYQILLRTSNVSGIKARAAVLMAGVPIGYVERIELAPDNKSVIMTARIYQQYMIRKNSIFAIEQSGFLGDQYVAINPQSNQGTFVQPMELVNCLPPFDLQDTARRASDLLSSVGSTLGDLKGAISNINESLLSPNNLTNYASNILVSLQNVREVTDQVRRQVPPALTNFQTLSENAKLASVDLQTLVREQTGTVSQAIANLNRASSNVTVFTETLKRTGQDLEQLIETNRPRVTATLKNVETASISVTNMLFGLQTDLASGKGLVGGLLRDEQMRLRTDLVLSNMVCLSSNLDVAAGNLNRYGLWWMLWKPKYPKTNPPANVKASGKGR